MGHFFRAVRVASGFWNSSVLGSRPLWSKIAPKCIFGSVCAFRNVVRKNVLRTNTNNFFIFALLLDHTMLLKKSFQLIFRFSVLIYTVFTNSFNTELIVLAFYKAI